MQTVFCFPEKMQAINLRDALNNLLIQEPVVEKLEQERVQKIISLKERIGILKDSLRKRTEILFSDIAKNSSSKSDIVVSFLAILEMVKQRVAKVEQSEIFSEIKIKSIKAKL
jgi:segregation and condensation protein A